MNRFVAMWISLVADECERRGLPRSFAPFIVRHQMRAAVHV